MPTEADYIIGSPEAWDVRERSALDSNFLPIDAFAQISDPSQYFLCGRRGTGKSAIALMLERNVSYSYRQAIQGESEEYGVYMGVVRDIRMYGATNDIDLKQAIRRLWLWALPVKAMQVVVAKSAPHDLERDLHLQVICRYLDSLPSPMYRDSRIGDLLVHTFRGALAALRTSTTAFDAHLMALTGDASFKQAAAALAAKSAEQPTLLVFDTLESYRVFDPDMVEGLRGILAAVVACATDQNMAHVAVKFFVPHEIYDRVFSPFPGKVTQRAVLLRWRSADLISMLSRRFLAVVERTQSVTEADLGRLRRAVDDAYSFGDGRRLRSAFWYDSCFLPRNITNRLGVTEDTLAYMFRHTLRRPRDLFGQMQGIINIARSRGEFPLMSKQSVVDGVHAPAVLEQIVADALVVYEGKLPGGFVSGAAAMFYGRERVMSKRDLRRFAQELYGIYPLENVQPEEFLDALFRCGVIGVVDSQPPSAGPEKYCRAHFSYIRQGELPQAERFSYCVHPALGDFLRMNTGTERGVIYPMSESEEESWLENLQD